MVKAFYAASLLMDVLSQFDATDEDVSFLSCPNSTQPTRLVITSSCSTLYFLRICCLLHFDRSLIRATIFFMKKEYWSYWLFPQNGIIGTRVHS